MADRDQIWSVFGDQVALHIAQVMGVVHLHVRTCVCVDVPPLCISETAGRIALKFGEWLWDQ